MKLLNLTRVTIAASVAGALAVAAIALASGAKPANEQAKANVTAPSTLLKFEHVQVVNATPEQIAAANKSTAPVVAQRAYLDADTKRLRPAFPEELATEAAAPKAAPSAPQVSTASDGTTRAVLDESFMSYSVAKVGADGKLKEDCVTNKPTGQAAIDAVATGVDNHEK